MGDQQEEDYTSGPLQDRLEHKKWKGRQIAYLELQRVFEEAEDDDDPVFKNYAPFMKKIIYDVNLMAQEKGLGAVLVWAERCPTALRVAGKLTAYLVDKAIAGRPLAKQTATKIILMLVEREAAEAVTTELLKGTKHKVPKVAAASVEQLCNALNQFGAKVVPVRLILKELSSLFNQTDKNVREQASKLATEVYAWIGDRPLQALLDELRSAQVKDLQARFERTERDRQPQRQLRSEMEQAMQGSGLGNNEEDEEAEDDPFQYMDEKDILSALDDEWFELLQSKKWKDRKMQLDKLFSLTSNARISTQGDFGPLVKALKTVVAKDANVMNVAKAIECIGNMACGMRAAFSPFARALLGPCLARYKEKKPFVISALNETLDKMHTFCFTLEEVLDDVQTAVSSKVPTVRAATFDWVQRCITYSVTSRPRNRAHITKGSLKPLAAMLLQGLDDTTPQARDASAKTFGTLVALVGERPMMPYFNKLESIKQKKVKEHWPENAVATVSSGAASATSSKGAAKSSGTPAKRSSVTSSSAGRSPAAAASTRGGAAAGSESSSTPAKRVTSAKSKARTPREGNIRAPVARRSPATSGNSGSSKKPSSSSSLSARAPSRGLMDAREAVVRAESIVSPSIIEKLGDSAWKTRVQACNALEERVQELHLQGTLQQHAHLLLSLIAARPSWTDSNTQVAIAAFGITRTVIQSAATGNTLSRGDAESIIKGIVDKVADAKLSDTVSQCLMTLAEMHSAAFVIENVHGCALAHRSPKVLLGAIQWISSCLAAFGSDALAGSSLASLVTFIRKALDSPNAQVRSNSVLLLGRIQTYVPAGAVKNHLSQLGALRASLASAIDKELAAAANVKPPPPSNGGTARSNASSGSTSSADSSRRGAPQPVQLMSRLKPDLIDRLGAREWATRKAAAEELDEAITRAGALLPDFDDLLHVFKERIVDGNKRIACLMLNVLQKLATLTGTALGSNPRNVSSIIPPVLASCSDKRVTKAAIDCLNAWANAVGLKCLVEHIASFLRTEHSAARHDVLSWLLEKDSSSDDQVTFAALPRGFDYRPLARALIACLEDRNSDARHAAESVLAIVCAHCGMDVVKRLARELKPASATAVNPLIDGLTNHELYRKHHTNAEADPAVSARASVTTGTAPTSSTTAVGGPRTALLRPLTRKAPQDIAALQTEWVGPLVQLALLNSDVTSSRTWRALRDELRTKFSSVVADPGLHEMMFSDDHDEQCRATTMLATVAVKEQSRTTLDHIASLLQWSALSLLSSDQSVVKAGLDLLVAATELMDRTGHHLTDYEAEIFIPLMCYLCGRWSRTDSHCQSARSAFRLVCRVFPASKLSALVLRTITPSSSTESPCEESIADVLLLLRYLVRRQGLHVCRPSESLPLISRFMLTGHKECLVHASSGFVAEVWVSIGDRLWEFVEHTDDIEELLRTAKTVPFSYSKTGPATVKLPTSQQDSNEQHVSAEVMGAWLAAINAGEHAMIPAIETLKVVCPHLHDGLIPPEYADLLVAALVLQLQRCFTCLPRRMSSSTVRYCKYIINALMSTFQGQSYAEQVSLQCLKDTMQCLLMKLQDSRIASMDEGRHILKALNLLVLKLIDHANRSFCFVALVQLLCSCIGNMGDNERYAEVVMKCIINITKSLKNTIGSIDLPPILQEIHTFFETVESAGATSSMPAKTIMTLLNEIVKLKGSSVKLCMQLVPTSPSVLLRSCVDKMLVANGESTACEEVRDEQDVSPSQESAPSPTPQQAEPVMCSNEELEAKERLAQLFADLRTVESESAREKLLRKLQRIQKAHPQLLEPFMAKTTARFREHIASDLERLSAETTVGESREVAATNDACDADERVLDRDEVEVKSDSPSTHQEESIETTKVEDADAAPVGQEPPKSSDIPAENESPNPAPVGITPKVLMEPSTTDTSASASNYMDRLRSFQRETGIHLRCADTTEVVIPAVVPATAPAAPASATSGGAASLSSLRKRLEQVRQQAAQSGHVSPPARQAMSVSERLESLRTPQQQVSLSHLKGRLEQLQRKKQ